MIKTISMYVSAEEAIDVAKQQNFSENFDEKDYEYEKNINLNMSKLYKTNKN